MKENKHTPGPWTVGPTDAKGNITILADTSRAIAIVRRTNSIGYSEEAIEANARLIAAAPDLLETLERIERSLRERLIVASPWGAELHQLVTATIAEATQEARPDPTSRPRQSKFFRGIERE